ncbi:hypothetical protein KC640_02215 [Candidatus Dojkabacteria bacterium]|uniref:histidine kinase n=1 Tax=Candidatus Dojkabacteria bacterium TaxID=2099670 RepID=A0A955KZK9_9BACT|nr:hypothetical protein [Candidatus Dojkabacteria bacterium]
MFWNKPAPQTDIEKLSIENEKLQKIAGLYKSITQVQELEKTLAEIFSGINSSLGYQASLLIAVPEQNKLEAFQVNSVASFLTKAFAKAGGSALSVPLKYSTPSEMGLAVKAYHTGEVQISNSMYEIVKPLISKSVGDGIQKLMGIKYGIVVPINSKEKTIAVLTAGSHTPISTQDKEHLLAYADLAGITLGNSQLFSQIQVQLKQLQSRNADMEALTSLIVTLSKTLDPKEVAQSAVNLLNKQEFIIGGALSMYDPEQDAMVSTAVSENQLAKKAKEIVGDLNSLVTKVNDPANQQNPAIMAFKTGKVQHTTDLKSYLSPVVPAKLVGPMTKLMQIKSVSIYPLYVRDKVVGTLAYYIKDNVYESLEPSRQKLLDTYSLQIGIALENAQLYTESQKSQKSMQQANTSLEEAVSALKEARRRERDMLDVMGHELRTPISIVRNALLMLDREHKKQDLQDAEIVKYLGMAIESTRREIFLIETLLSATKVDGSRIQMYFEEIGIKDVITDAIEAQSSTLHTKNLKLVYTPPADDVMVYADRTRTQEIMDNLLSNAIKYTMKGEIKMSLWQDQEFGWVSVQDSGMGIAEADMQQLGRKFFRAKQYVDTHTPLGENAQVVRPGGTGLGLYVTFDLIGTMKGKLYINSELGKGSTFTFGLPLSKGQEPKQMDQTFDPQQQKDRSHIIIGQEAPKPA